MTEDWRAVVVAANARLAAAMTGEGVAAAQMASLARRGLDTDADATELLLLYEKAKADLDEAYNTARSEHLERLQRERVAGKKNQESEYDEPDLALCVEAVRTILEKEAKGDFSKALAAARGLVNEVDDLIATAAAWAEEGGDDFVDQLREVARGLFEIGFSLGGCAKGHVDLRDAAQDLGKRGREASAAGRAGASNDRYMEILAHLRAYLKKSQATPEAFDREGALAYIREQPYSWRFKKSPSRRTVERAFARARKNGNI
jgi:hypothetical protein